MRKSVYARICIYIYVYSERVGTTLFSALNPAERKEKLTAVINVLRRPFCVGGL